MAPSSRPSLYDQALADFCSSVRQSKAKDDDDEKQLRDFLAGRGKPREVKDAAILLQKEAGSKYSAKKIGSKTVIPKTWIDNVLGNISNAISVGDTLLKDTPESVSMAWFCIKLGLNAIQSNYKLYSLFGSGIQTTTEVIILVAHYDKLYDERDNAAVEMNELTELLFRQITSIYSLILDFSFSIKRHVETDAMGRVRHAFKDFFGAELSKFSAKQDAILDLKAKVLESSSAAFQSRSFDKMGDVSASLKETVDNITSFDGMARELAQGQADVLRELQELKASVKQKSRWEWLIEDYEKHKKALDPREDSADILDTLRKERDAETAQWIFNTPAFRSWMSDDLDESLLVLTGHEGSGKSIVMTSVFDMPSDLVKWDDVCLVSCAGRDGQQTGLTATQVRHSIIHEVYKIATALEDHPDVLEKCNQIFQVSKMVQELQQKTGLAGANHGSHIPGFEEAILDLTLTLDRSCLIILDGVDQLSREDQVDLGNSIYDLSRASSARPVRLLLTARSNSPLASLAAAKSDVLVLNVSDENKADMRLVLSSKLEGLAGWTDAERKEARQRVLERAGSRFSYIASVAMPYLRQPFQRPISRHLAGLPNGISDSYNQALRTMPQNYLDLLRTALTWTLYSAKSVRVHEVMEAFACTYTVAVEITEPIPDDYPSKYGYGATELELEQLDLACGPFLRISTNAAKEQVVALQDAAQVQKFCARADDRTDEGVSHELTYCAKCQADMSMTTSLSLPEREVHLKLAIQLVKHLNSKLFQRRFLLREGDDEESGDENEDLMIGDDQELTDDDADESDVQSSDAPSASGKDGALVDLTTGDDKMIDAESERGFARKYDQERHTRTHSRGTEPLIHSESFRRFGEDGIGYFMDDGGYRSDDSLEDEDNDEVDAGQQSDAEDNNNDEDDDCFDLRYEVQQWHYHARKADDMWTDQEKEAEPQWAELMVELDRFAFDNAFAFVKWQLLWADDMKNTDEGTWMAGAVGPLHIAACFGLTCWAAHLISEKGYKVSEVSEGRNPLQAAALRSDCPRMLALLLKQPDADVHFRGGEEEPPSALHEWLMTAPTAESVRLFSSHGADFALQDEFSGSNALHSFASSEALNPAALDIILNAIGPNPGGVVNASDKAGETPLHYLLYRPNVPLDILKSLLKAGAEINAENASSIRPLQIACALGKRAIVEVMLDHGITEISDEDLEGDTALHDAARQGASGCIKALIAAKVDIDHQNKAKRTALHLAAWQGHLEAVKALIEGGAAPNCVDNHQRTPFWWACYGTSEDTALFLLDHLHASNHSIGDINKPSVRSRTPLRLAASHGHENVVAKLIGMTVAADVELLSMLDLQDTKIKATALMRAAWRGHVECVRILLAHKADASLVDGQGLSALQMARSQWQQTGEKIFEQIILLLLESVEDADIEGDKDLPSTAANHNSVAVLAKIHARGGNVNQPDSFGWAPLTFAERAQHSEAIRFLKQQTSWRNGLPSRWVRQATSPQQLNIEEGGMLLTHTTGEECCLTTDRPLPASLDRFYWEAESVSFADDQLAYPDLCLGFSNMPAAAFRRPGWAPRKSAPSGRSWAYHGDTGWVVDATLGQTFSKTFGPGDTVGCGVDLAQGVIWFTLNGGKVEYELSGVSGRLFPIIGFSDKVQVRTNFGTEPFKWTEAGDEVL